MLLLSNSAQIKFSRLALVRPRGFGTFAVPTEAATPEQVEQSVECDERARLERKSEESDRKRAHTHSFSDRI